MLMVMAAYIVGTHGRYYCGLWILIVLIASIVDAHGYGCLYCGYSWPWSLLLSILMATNIVNSDGNYLCYCKF